MVDGTHDHHVQPRPGEDHIESLLSTRLVDGSKVHPHLAVMIRRVADAEQDNVALVPLYVLQIFHKQPAELTILFALVFCGEKVTEVLV